MLPDNVSDARRVLAGTSLLHLLQSRSGQQQGVLSLAHDSTVGDALNDLSSRGVLSAPLVVFNTLRDEGGEDDEADFSDARPEVPTFLGTCFTKMTPAFADTQSKAFLMCGTSCRRCLQTFLSLQRTAHRSGRRSSAAPRRASWRASW